jgi:tetratricopeptide (TPR) repeat protein
MQDFDRVIEIDPNYTKVEINQNIVNILLGYYDKAEIMKLKDYIKKDSKSAEAYLCLGIVFLSNACLKLVEEYAESESYKKAIENISMAIKLKSDFIDVEDLLKYARKKKTLTTLGKVVKKTGGVLLKALEVGAKLVEEEYNRRVEYAEKHGIEIPVRDKPVVNVEEK